MPKIIAKVEGKGNGIKTVIVNMVEISKSLARPPAYPTKFFGCELGTQTQIDKKNGRYIVNGSHDGDKLQDILDIFIDKFVLCDECDNPETVFLVQPKREKITSTCSACGHSSLIDMRHRLSTFILKNPPEGDDATPQKLKKLKKEKDKNAQNGDTSPTDKDESGFDGWSDDLPTANKTNVDEWSTDTSAEAVRQRMSKLGVGVKGLTHNEDLEKSTEERFQIFFQFVKDKVSENNISDKEIVAEADRLDMKDRAVLALAEILLDKDILTQLPKYRVLFLRFLATNQKSQKHFMGAFEILVGQLHKNDLLPKTAKILSTLYDQDFIEEEVLLEWGSKVSKKYVDKKTSEQIHSKAKPFLDWLKTADEEDSDDEDVEVVYTNRTEEAVLKEEEKKKKEAEKAAQPATENNEEDDDIDIDDI